MQTFSRAHEGAEVCSARLTRNEKYVLTAGKDSCVKLWELAANRCLIAYTGAGAMGVQVIRQGDPDPPPPPIGFRRRTDGGEELLLRRREAEDALRDREGGVHKTAPGSVSSQEGPKSNRFTHPNFHLSSPNFICVSPPPPNRRRRVCKRR